MSDDTQKKPEQHAARLDPKALRPYVLKKDRGKANPPTWMCRVLGNRELAAINDCTFRYDSDGNRIMQLFSAQIMFVKAGLRGGQNLLDYDGYPLQFEAENSGEPTEDFIDLLDPSWFSELSDFISERCKLSEDEKNG